MASVGTILMVFAFVLLALAAFNVAKDSTRISIGWAGMACWALAIVLGGLSTFGR